MNRRILPNRLGQRSVFERVVGALALAAVPFIAARVATGHLQPAFLVALLVLLGVVIVLGRFFEGRTRRRLLEAHDGWLPLAPKRQSVLGSLAFPSRRTTSGGLLPFVFLEVHADGLVLRPAFSRLTFALPRVGIRWTEVEEVLSVQAGSGLGRLRGIHVRTRRGCELFFAPWLMSVDTLWAIMEELRTDKGEQRIFGIEDLQSPII